MTQTAKGKEFELDCLLHPGQVFGNPMEIVKDPDLTTQEKRAILASWASDACAVESASDLRQPPAAPPVRFEEVMDALMSCDGDLTEQPCDLSRPSLGRARALCDL